jgi:hypothetical protein
VGLLYLTLLMDQDTIETRNILGIPFARQLLPFMVWFQVTVQSSLVTNSSLYYLSMRVLIGWTCGENDWAVLAIIRAFLIFYNMYRIGLIITYDWPSSSFCAVMKGFKSTAISGIIVHWASVRNNLMSTSRYMTVSTFLNFNSCSPIWKCSTSKLQHHE